MITALRTEKDRFVYWAAIGALIAAAWLALVLVGSSPYAGYLDHDEAFATRLPLAARFSLFVGGWTLMTVAMMLPTSLPLVTVFRLAVRLRADAGTLLALLISGYLAVWGLFGATVYLLDTLLHVAVERAAILEASVRYLPAGVLLLAGLYQFSPLKHQCLEKCRSPFSFVAEHWRRGTHADALRLGAHHGLFCLGCCWTLMLLMFAVGGVNLAWMLALGVVMAAEKSAPWGSRLTAPAGVMLIALGALASVQATAGGGA